MWRWTDLIFVRRTHLFSPVQCKVYAVMVINWAKSRDLEQSGKWILPSCSLLLSLVLVYSLSFWIGTRGYSSWLTRNKYVCFREVADVNLNPFPGFWTDGYYLIRMGVDPQMLVAQDGFAEPGGLSSAQIVVISWINNFILLTGNRLDFGGTDVPHLLGRL